MGFLDTNSANRKKTPLYLLKIANIFLFELYDKKKQAQKNGTQREWVVLSAFDWNDLIKRSDENKSFTILCNEQDQ